MSGTEVTSVSIECQACGVEFLSQFTDRRYCCKRCHDQAKVLRKALRRDVDKPTPTCFRCGKETSFYKTSGKPKRYCSHECVVARRPKPHIPITCPWCKQDFVQNIRSQKYCCTACRQKDRNEKNRSIGSSKVAAMLRGRTHARRCAKFSRKYEIVDPMDVHTRDGWVCQICMAPVCKDSVFPDPLSATVDHIVPLSRGGDHVMNNLQTAHWMCNSAKRCNV